MLSIKRLLLSGALMASLILGGCAVEPEVKPSNEAIIPVAEKPVDNNLTEDQVREDFDYLWKILSENYPFFELNKRVNNIDFLAQKELYWQQVSQAKTRDDLYELLCQVLKELHNDHTTLLSKKNDSFERNYYYGLLRPLTEEDKQLPYFKFIMDVFGAEESLNYYGKLPENPDMSQPESLKIGNYSDVNNVLVSSFNDNKIQYIRIDSFSYYYFKRDFKYIYDYIKNNKQAEAMIIDIRNNGGGYAKFWSELFVEPNVDKIYSKTNFLLFRDGAYNETYMKGYRDYMAETIYPIQNLDKNNFSKAQNEVFTEFKSYFREDENYMPANSTGFKGKIYLLIGPGVYSAAEKFANFSKYTGFATLIGQKTGGDGLTRTPIFYTLPNSGIIGKYAYIYGMNANGEANEEYRTEPDYKLENIEQPVDLKKDPCINQVLELEKKRKK